MLGIRENQKNEHFNDMEWENMGSFIADLAKNNESVTDESVSEVSRFTNSTKKRAELAEKTVTIKAEIGKTSPDNRSISGEQELPANYDTLQTDIRGLLDELQEIKLARMSLQSKLTTIRQ